MSEELDVIDTISQMNAAHTSMLLALAKTLEEAGAMSVEHFQMNVRIIAELTAREKPGFAADLLFQFVEQLDRDIPEGRA